MVDRGPLLTSAIIFYLSIGAAIFEVLEEPNWRLATDAYKLQKSQLLKEFPCLGQEGLDKILQVRARRGGGRPGGRRWPRAGARARAGRCRRGEGAGHSAPPARMCQRVHAPAPTHLCTYSCTYTYVRQGWPWGCCGLGKSHLQSLTGLVLMKSNACCKILGPPKVWGPGQPPGLPSLKVTTVCTHILVRVLLHVHGSTWMHMDTYACRQVCAHAHTWTHIHIHACACTHPQSPSCSPEQHVNGGFAREVPWPWAKGCSPAPG